MRILRLEYLATNCCSGFLYFHLRIDDRVLFEINLQPCSAPAKQCTAVLCPVSQELGILIIIKIYKTNLYLVWSRGVLN